MNRRTFVKGLLFSMPGIYLNPIKSLCAKLPDLETSSLDSRPLIIFIGDYGRLVMDQYVKKQADYPIARPCRHVRPDINLVSEFIHLEGTQRLSLPKLENSLLMIVFDGFIHEYRKLAMLLAKYYQRSKGTYSIAIVPNASISTPDSLYDLVLTQRWMEYEAPAMTVHSFYKTYCGCSGLGNLVCLKAHLDDFRHAGSIRGQTLSAISFRSLDDPLYRKLKLEAALATTRMVQTEYQDALLYAIIELPETIKDPLKICERIELELSGGMLDLIRSLPHPNSYGKHIRLTLIKLT